jgi:hypothetical protein
MAKKKNKAAGGKPPETEQPDVELENKRRELFCRLYAQGEGTFGNATLSYAEAYEHEITFAEKTDRWGNIYRSPVELAVYNMCSAHGSRLVRDGRVKDRITVLLNELLKDEIVDAELVKVIKQNGDLAPKVQAIKEYNKLRGRIIDKSQVTQVQKLDMDDIRTLISVLPLERQEYFYATISDILAEAELRRSGGKSQNNPSERPENDTKEVPE